jgi:hypothetical protein
MYLLFSKINKFICYYNIITVNNNNNNIYIYIGSLLPLESTTLTVIFTPTAAVKFSYTLSLVNDNGNTFKLDVNGEGISTLIYVCCFILLGVKEPLIAEPSSLSFGAVAIGETKTLRIVICVNDEEEREKLKEQGKTVLTKPKGPSSRFVYVMCGDGREAVCSDE